MKLATWLCAALAVGLAGGHTSAGAQSYPTRPIKFIVGFAPGGGGDVIGRVVATKLSATIGQSVYVENRPGATGTTAANQVAKSPPDGYTLLVGAVSTNSIAPSLYRNLPYDNEKDLAGVTLLASLPNLISVHPSTGFNSLGDLIAYAKANPGALSFPSAGNGSTPHLAGELFKQMTGTNLLHVPYKGAGASVADLLAGTVKVSFDTSGTIITYLSSGKLKALAIAAPRRFSPIPNVPTAGEAGVPGYEVSTWIGLFAPGATPRPIVEKLHHEIAQVLKQPETRDTMKNQFGTDDTVTNSPEEFDRLVKSDTARYSKLIKSLGLKVD